MLPSTAPKDQYGEAGSPPTQTGRPKPVQDRVGHTAGVGDSEHTQGGAGEGTAFPCPSHPPPLARAAGGRGSMPEAKGAPIPGLAAGERGRALNSGESAPPSLSVPTPAQPQQAPVPERGQGEGDRTPSASRVASCSSHSSRHPSSAQRGPGQGLRPVAGDLGRQSQRRPPGRPRDRSEGAGGTEPGLGEQS